MIGLEGKNNEFFIPPVYSKITIYDYLDEAILYEGKKAGLYNFKDNILILPYKYDAIYNMGLYVIEQKGKVGIFDADTGGTESQPILIEPYYDKFITRIDLRSSRMNFLIYKFINNGKVCYVGMNGVKFFEETK